MHKTSCPGAALAAAVVLLSIACDGSGGDRAVTSPGFSLAGANAVQTGLHRQAHVVEPDGRITALEVPDTSEVHATFDGVFAFADSAAGVVGPVSVRDHADFSGAEGGYWTRTDSAGRLHGLRLSADGGAWSAVELFTNQQPVATFRWTWTRVADGWHLKAAHIVLPLEDGAVLDYASTPHGTPVILSDATGPGRSGTVAAGVGLVDVIAGRVLPTPLAAEQVACSNEVVEAAAAAAFASAMWWRARKFPTPSRVRQAWAASAYATKKAADAVKCLLRQPPALDVL